MEIRRELISSNRPGTPINPQFVTLHNTGNPNSTAQANRNYFHTHPQAQVSAHWVVDDKEAIQCIPEGEIAWHAGQTGNRQSIGIEVCEFTDPIRHERAYQNAVRLCADILRRWGWGVDRLTTHQRWTGKQCPRHILPIWSKFVGDVENVMRPQGPAVMVNGQLIPAIIHEGRMYTPIRAPFEVLGYKVDYDSATRIATIRR